MNRAAESYVKLVLAMGEHEPDYVDAYYGPPEWRASMREKKPSLAEIHRGATALHDELTAMEPPHDAMARLRLQYLTRQTEAAIGEAGFAIERIERFEFAPSLLDRLAASHILGSARRP